MVIFQIGDKVVLKQAHRQELGHRWRDSVGTIISTHRNSTNQYCRVSYSKSMFDYEDFGAWRLVLVEPTLV